MMDRNRLPRWINALVDSIADAPMSPIGRLAARQYGTPAPAGSVPSSRFADRRSRVLIAPVNYSGQGREWARALEHSTPDISAQNFAIDVPGGFSFDADIVVPVATYHNDSDWQRREFEAAAGATHVLIEAEEPPFGRLLGRSVAAQSQALLDRGVDVAFLAHGTDARLPSRHIETNPWSYYRDESIYLPRAETLAARNIALLESSGRPLFVSTPDLLLDLPSAHWCPVVVDPKRWETRRTARATGSPLRVAHAPSVSAVKGTQLILPALERLVDEKVITLDLVTGVPTTDMPQRFANADVVIDQMRVGSYGVAAVEAMASGCVVVGHVSDEVRALITAQSGANLPIVEATVDIIERVLRDLAGDQSFMSRRAQGLDFVQKLHDGRYSAKVLREHWIDRIRADDRRGTADASTR